MYKDNIKKGRDYEIFISNHFEKLGYKTKNHGLIHGRKDKGIDLIIMKNKEITLIQCKNWKADGRRIKHNHLKEFLGNTTVFLEDNNDKAKGYNIKILYITSNDILDNSARHFLRENHHIIEHQIIAIN